VATETQRGDALDADYGRSQPRRRDSAPPKMDPQERGPRTGIHPSHIHFEEGQILDRNGEREQRPGVGEGPARTSIACARTAP